MGAGILPTTLYQGQLYFLFGKENRYEDSASGFSDFGGGTDNTESYLQTAIREGTEELTGFLGNQKELREKLTRYGNYPIDHQSEGFHNYRMFIFPMKYDPALPYYYNNNQKFLQRKLEPRVIQKSKIFEKEEIRWIPISELKKMRPKFRCYFRHMIDKILEQQREIREFIERSGLWSEK